MRWVGSEWNRKHWVDQQKTSIGIKVGIKKITNRHQETILRRGRKERQKGKEKQSKAIAKKITETYIKENKNKKESTKPTKK